MRHLPFLLGLVAFGLAYGQAPLYYSNQNQYFLHGLANANVGLLSEDWLANTTDPVPIFSVLVTFTVRFLHPLVFHLYYLVLQGIYAASLLGLFLYLAGPRDTPRLRIGFLFLIVAIHSGAARWLSYRLLGLDYPWYLQAGLAGQYVLGGMFQPSTFGVFLLLALVLFLRGHPFVAAALASLTATIHFTYVLPAAMFTLGFLYLTWRERGFRQAALLGSWGLLWVLPMLVFVLVQFRPTSAEMFREAQHILVHFRIPHHCLPHLWLDPVAGFQIAWICAGALLAYGTRLFPLMAIAIGIATGLTVLQVLTDSDMLALLFPWRVSALLVPMATAVLLSRLVLLLRTSWDRIPAQWIAVCGMAALAVTGTMLVLLGQAYRSPQEDLPLMADVKAKSKSGEVYLMPTVKLPELEKTTRGSTSPDFRPFQARRKDQKLIPMDLQRFRLFAEAPIYVDFKAIPYLDRDVLEWRRRLDQTVAWQRAIRAGKLNQVRDELIQAGITHVIVTAEHELTGPDWEETFSDEAYRVYRLRGSS